MGWRIGLLVTLLVTGCAPRSPQPLPFEEERESPATQVTSGRAGQDRDPELSPDGKLLYYASSSFGPSYDLYVREIGSNTATRLTSLAGDERFPKVCPANPRLLAFSGDGEGEWAIYVLNVERPSQIQRVTESGVHCIHPSWSPDGRLLVYCAAEDTAGPWTIRIRDLMTGRTQVFDDLEGLLPNWAPAGNRIVFQRMRARDGWLSSIWTFEYEAGAARNVTVVLSSDEWGAINPSWSPDGKWIVFATVAKSPSHLAMLDRGDDLWAIRPNGAHATRLTTSTAADWMPAWSADDRVYFVSDRGGSQRIWSLAPQGLEGR